MRLSRRLAARSWWLLTVVVFACGMNSDASRGADPNKKASRPNVVIVLADDMGYSDLGCYGGEIDTPNLDLLAGGGLRFAQFYNTARCWPTRAAIMTGLYPHQASMAMNFGPEAPRAYTGRISPQCRMIPELLATTGYRSYHSGKWHLNNRSPTPNETWPLGRGYAHSYILFDHNNYFTPKRLFEDHEQVKKLPADFYVTDGMTDHAVAYLQEHAERHAGDPFFLYLAYTAPHFPLHARAEDVARFRGRYREGWDKVREQRYERMREIGLIQCSLSPRDEAAQPWDSLSEAQKEQWDARMATYAGMIHCVDRGVGRVVQQIQAMNALDDTLILFLSDNGSSAEYIVRGDGHDPAAPPGSRETFQCLEVGWSNVANTPFRQHKIWVHEGGISTPLIAHWPRGISARGEITQQVGHVIDLLPTVAELAGFAYPAEFQGEKTVAPPGKSLVSIFKGDKKPIQRDFLFWEHEGNRALRRGDWKVVAERDGPWELYDLAADRSETKNLAAERSDLLRDLTAQWQQYADKIGVVEWATFNRKRPNREEYREK